MPATSTAQPIYDRTLRTVALCGYWTLSLTLGFFGVLAMAKPDPYSGVWKLILFHFVAGRAGNVALGVEMDIPRLFLFFQCFVQDILVLFLLYPLAIIGYRRAVESRILGPTLARVRIAADQHKSRVEPFGAIGLVAFVVFPLWSTGPLVGAVVGYLLGMRTKLAFAAVIVGNAIAVGIWVAFFERLKTFNEHMSRSVLVAIVVAVVIIAAAVQIRRLIRVRADEAYLERIVPDDDVPEQRSDDTNESN